MGSPKRIIDFLQMAVIANNLVNQKEDRQSHGNDRLPLWKYKIVVDTERVGVSNKQAINN